MDRLNLRSGPCSLAGAEAGGGRGLRGPVLPSGFRSRSPRPNAGPTAIPSTARPGWSTLQPPGPPAVARHVPAARASRSRTTWWPSCSTAPRLRRDRRGHPGSSCSPPPDSHPAARKTYDETRRGRHLREARLASTCPVFRTSNLQHMTDHGPRQRRRVSPSRKAPSRRRHGVDASWPRRRTRHIGDYGPLFVSKRGQPIASAGGYGQLLPGAAWRRPAPVVSQRATSTSLTLVF
jgi:hypothetical protein